MLKGIFQRVQLTYKENFFEIFYFYTRRDFLYKNKEVHFAITPTESLKFLYKPIYGIKPSIQFIF